MTSLSGGAWRNCWGNFRQFFLLWLPQPHFNKKTRFFTKNHFKVDHKIVKMVSRRPVICICIGRFGRTLHAKTTGCGDGPPQASSIFTLFPGRPGSGKSLNFPTNNMILAMPPSLKITQLFTKRSQHCSSRRPLKPLECSKTVFYYF